MSSPNNNILKEEHPMAAETLNLKKAAEFLDITTGRLRALAKENRIPATKERIGDSEIVSWRFRPEDLATYAANHTKGSRATGAKAWVIRLSQEQLAQLAPKFDELGIDLEARHNYDPEKSKAYRLRRKAAKAASADEDELEIDDDEFDEDEEAEADENESEDDEPVPAKRRGRR